MPTIYRFAKRGRLRKSNDGRFHPPKNNEAPADESESASKVTGEVAASPIESREAREGFFD